MAGMDECKERLELKKSVLPIQAWALAVGAIIGLGVFYFAGYEIFAFIRTGCQLFGALHRGFCNVHCCFKLRNHD